MKHLFLLILCLFVTITVFAQQKCYKVEYTPATFIEEEMTIQVAPQKDSIVIIQPAQYARHTEKRLVSDAYTDYEMKDGKYCEVAKPALYETIVIEKLITPPVTKTIIVAAKYRTIRVKRKVSNGKVEMVLTSCD